MYMQVRRGQALHFIERHGWKTIFVSWIVLDLPYSPQNQNPLPPSHTVYPLHCNAAMYCAHTSIRELGGQPDLCFSLPQDY